MINIIIVAVLSLIASMVATISGFGLSTIMVPSLLLFMPFQGTMVLVGIIHLVNNMWRVRLFYKHIHGTIFFYFGIPSLLASALGALLIPQNGTSYLLPLLGLFLIAYVLFLFYTPSFHIKPASYTAFIGGAASGFSAGFFGIKGAIQSAFLTAYHLPKKQYIATISSISLITDIVRVAIYLVRGFAVSHKMLVGLFIFIPVTILGVYIARFIVRIIPQRYFRFVVALFLLTVGIKFVLVEGIWEYAIAVKNI